MQHSVASFYRLKIQARVISTSMRLVGLSKRASNISKYIEHILQSIVIQYIPRHCTYYKNHVIPKYQHTYFFYF